MPHGSRIVALSALVLAGCQSAPKPESKPLRATVQPTANGKTPSRADLTSPVVKSTDFQKTLPIPSTPQPGVAPPVNVPTIPSTSYPVPTPSEPVPPSAPGLATPTQPPIAESGANDTGGIVMPNLFEKK
jgi:hypothetical protein